MAPEYERYIDELRRIADDETFHKNLRGKVFMNVVDLVGFDSPNEPVLVLACGELKRKQALGIVTREHGALKAA